MAASAARTSRTSSPKDNTDESLAAGGLTPGLDGLERFAAVAYPGVAGGRGGDAPDAGRARLFGGIEARRGRDPKPAGDFFDTPGTAPEACAGRTTSAVVRRVARLEKDTARPRCMRRPLARGVRLGGVRSRPDAIRCVLETPKLSKLRPKISQIRTVGKLRPVVALPRTSCRVSAWSVERPTTYRACRRESDARLSRSVASQR